MEVTGAPRTGIVILNWKGWPDTVECVRSCLQLDQPDTFIVVVDNDSGDGSVERLAAEFGAEPSVHILESGGNLGFAGGNNVGIAHALERGADYIWLLNNDTVVDASALSALVSAAEGDPGVGVWGSKIYYHDRPDVLWYAGATIDTEIGWTHHLGQGEVDTGQYDEVHDTEYVTGCSLLVSAAVIERIGLMDERYFLYWEEVDWCFRAREHGWRCAVQPASLVWHKVSSSASSHPRMQVRYEMRNRLIFHRLHRRASLGRVFRQGIRMALAEYFRGDRETGAGYLAGIWDFLLGRSGRIGQ